MLTEFRTRYEAIPYGEHDTKKEMLKIAPMGFVDYHDEYDVIQTKLNP